MSPLIWCLTIAMSLVAVTIVASPMWTRKSKLSKTTLAMCAALPIFATTLYAGIGTPTAVTMGSRQHSSISGDKTAASNGQQTRSAGSVGSLLQGLKDKLEQNPDDAGSWLLLAKSYEHLGQTAEANAAYERARVLGKSDPDLERSLLGESASRELSTNPVPEIQTGPAIRGRVSLGTDAAAIVKPGDTVFIFARESLEQRMPVVALRRSAAELPIEFVMTDSDAMIAGTRLADFGSLIVTAKISRTGLATDVIEGLEISSNAVSPEDVETVELVITAGTGDE